MADFARPRLLLTGAAAAGLGLAAGLLFGPTALFAADPPGAAAGAAWLRVRVPSSTSGIDEEWLNLEEADAIRFFERGGRPAATVILAGSSWDVYDPVQVRAVRTFLAYREARSHQR